MISLRLKEPGAESPLLLAAMTLIISVEPVAATLTRGRVGRGGLAAGPSRSRPAACTCPVGAASPQHNGPQRRQRVPVVFSVLNGLRKVWFEAQGVRGRSLLHETAIPLGGKTLEYNRLEC